MNREQDLRRRQLAKLRSYLERSVLPFSKHYGAMFEERKIAPTDLREAEDMERIPFTSKGDLLGNTLDFVLAPDEMALKRRLSTVLRGIFTGPTRTKRHLEHEYRPVFLTSTTGRSSEPVPFLFTGVDLDNLAKAGRDIMEIGGSRPEWRHLNLFPYAPHLAFWLAHYAGTAFHTFMLSTGGGKVMGTEGNVRFMERTDPDILIGMPTFLYHALQVALDSGVKLTKLKRIVMGGEKAPTGMRMKLHELGEKLGVGGIDVIATYGCTEMKMAFPECPFEVGGEPSGYHVNPDLMYIEVVDPETGRLRGEGEGGEIVFTPLNARGSVTLRYRTGDIISEGLVFEPCPRCGRTLSRLKGRISRQSQVKRLSIDKIKGTLVNFNDLENLLDDMEGVGGWQVELRKERDDPYGLDQLIIHANATGDVEGLREAMEKRCQESAEIKPNDVVFHSAEEIREMLGVGNELKEKKLVDNRPKVKEASP